MSEQAPKNHQSLAGHFPTFNEMKYIRGLTNIFKPSHFRVMGGQQRNPERPATTTCVLYHSTLRTTKSNIMYCKILLLPRSGITVLQDSWPHFHGMLTLTGCRADTDVAHPAVTGLIFLPWETIHQSKRTTSRECTAMAQVCPTNRA